MMFIFIGRSPIVKPGIFARGATMQYLYSLVAIFEMQSVEIIAEVSQQASIGQIILDETSSEAQE